MAALQCSAGRGAAARFRKGSIQPGHRAESPGQGCGSPRELKDIQGLHDFRTRLAESKSLIIAGGAIGEKETPIGLSPNFSARSKRVLLFRRLHHYAGWPGSAKEKSTRR